MYYIIYFIYVSFFAQHFFFLDFWLPVVYLLFNEYIILYLNYTSALIGEACFV